MVSAVTYSVIIPVHNGAKTLDVLCTQLNVVMNDHEIILVDDGSTDDSWECIRQLSIDHDTVKGIRLQQNYGQHPATLCGLQHASGRFCITMDDDMQHMPKDIPLLIKTQEENNSDVVYACFERRHESTLRKTLSSLFRWNARLLGYRHEATSFRLMTGKISKQLVSAGGSFIFIDALLPKFTSRITFVNVQHHERAAGHSGYTLDKLLKLYMGIARQYILPAKRKKGDNIPRYKISASTE